MRAITNTASQPLRYLYLGAGLSAFLGSLAAVITALANDGGWSDGFRWILYAAAFALVAGVLGLIFGVPRARPEFVPAPTERYLANSSLEEISDWLTKLLVGAGLVEVKSLPGGLKSLGDFLGADLTVGNSSAYAVSAVIYGAGLGFAIGYLWTRLRLRVLLETSDTAAAEASRTKDVVVKNLTLAASSGNAEPDATLQKVARRAVALSSASESREWLPILWVDDNPGNNAGIVAALGALEITVESVRSTEEALGRIDAHPYALIISDLGRKENGENNEFAGRDLLLALRERAVTTPVIIFAGRNGMAHRDELMAAGARLVSQQPSEVFDAAVSYVTGRH